MVLKVLKRFESGVHSLNRHPIGAKNAHKNGFYNASLFGNHTVMILIDATTLLHKSTLSTNNFENNHFGQKYQKQNILRSFRFYWCLFDKFPTDRAKTKKCVFGQIFHFFETFVTLKIHYGILIHQ